MRHVVQLFPQYIRLSLLPIQRSKRFCAWLLPRGSVQFVRLCMRFDISGHIQGRMLLLLWQLFRRNILGLPASTLASRDLGAFAYRH
jgi:hypothetical protein